MFLLRRSYSSRSAVISEKVDSKGHLVLVKLNRGEKLNAITEEVGKEFEATLKRLPQEFAEARAVVVTGEGRAFSAGGDMEFLRDRVERPAEENARTMVNFYKRMLSVRQCTVPVIAAINGHAVGAGLCFAAACDLRFVSSSAKLGVNFTSLGLSPGMAGTNYLRMLVGEERATKMLLTGELISGEEAARIGFALEAVPAEEVLSKAIELANTIAIQSPTAVRSTIRIIRSHQDRLLPDTLLLESDGQAKSYSHPEFLEGLNAIMEKRKPQF